jgi:hypothetical protein
MTTFWGDESWRQSAYDTTSNLFGYEEKTSNEEMAQAFQKRLKKVGGFKYVRIPFPCGTVKAQSFTTCFSQQGKSRRMT